MLPAQRAALPALSNGLFWAGLWFPTSWAVRARPTGSPSPLVPATWKLMHSKFTKIRRIQLLGQTCDQDGREECLDQPNEEAGDNLIYLTGNWPLYCSVVKLFSGRSLSQSSGQPRPINLSRC
ncbi:hypothetical protein PCASD_12574 [Puccinia coronata f. sp. avenae]|uniref:Uncharacterized protein n=1 Tax=Puccinia coronata f. sp. avenae TaxID=200324 RepID=A0A2N5UMD9_9BASI|nr:hypothetical protein PCASD_12574 [Puccinia coronata f. sp. avenae]